MGATDECRQKMMYLITPPPSNVQCVHGLVLPKPRAPPSAVPLENREEWETHVRGTSTSGRTWLAHTPTFTTTPILIPLDYNLLLALLIPHAHLSKSTLARNPIACRRCNHYCRAPPTPTTANHRRGASPLPSAREQQRTHSSAVPTFVTHRTFQSCVCSSPPRRLLQRRGRFPPGKRPKATTTWTACHPTFLDRRVSWIATPATPSHPPRPFPRPVPAPPYISAPTRKPRRRACPPTCRPPPQNTPRRPPARRLPPTQTSPSETLLRAPSLNQPAPPAIRTRAAPRPSRPSPATTGR